MIVDSLRMYKLLTVNSAELLKKELAHAISGFRVVIKNIKLTNELSWHNSAYLLELADEQLSRLWNQLSHYDAVLGTEAMRAAYSELLPQITELYTEVMQDQELYVIFEKLSTSDLYISFSAPRRKIISNMLRDFRLSGVHLAAEKRTEFKKLVETSSNLQNLYSNNIVDATDSYHYEIAESNGSLTKGIPNRILDNCKTKTGWKFKIDTTNYIGIISYADNETVREEVYSVYTTRASELGRHSTEYDNTTKIQQILECRNKKARLLNFANYAEYSLATKMANNVEEVSSFLEDLVKKIKPKAEVEFENLCSYAGKKLNPWDVAYYSEKLKLEKFKIDDEQLRKYFPLDKVINGMFALVNKLFGIEIKEITDVEKWHPDVKLFEIAEADNTIGYFYVDLFARDKKRGGAWMADLYVRMRKDKILQKPASFLTCNFAIPQKGKQALLDHQEVVTLFHEFGHTLQYQLTKMEDYSVSGINGIEWDAVELPSQFMENWCWEWAVVSDISESMPRDIFDNLLASKNFQAAMALLRQLEFSTFDLEVHRNKDVNALEIYQEINQKLAVLPVPASNRFPNTFSHIFAGGYAAGYYSYLWAEVLSCDAFYIFKQNGLYNQDIANSFRQNILEPGGSRKAIESFESFAGRKPDPEALIKHYSIT